MMMFVEDTHLAAYVDGELNSAQLADVEKFLARSEDARRKVKELRDVTARLRTSCAAQRFMPVPEKFLALASSSLPAQEGQRPRRVFSKPRWVRQALAASFLLLALAGATYSYHALWSQQGSASVTDELLEELAEYHVVYARETEHLVEVPAARKAHIEEWLGSRLNRKLTVPDLTSDGLEFIGARMLVMEGHPVAQLIYKRDDEPPIALCVTLSELSKSSFSVDKYHGLIVGHWNEDGYIYVLVGDLPIGNVRHLATEVEAQLAGSF
jgi:anti-sigma factor RsiW